MFQSGFYSDTFFDEQGSISVASARRVVPLVVGLVEPRSVVDVGCGIGAWLAVFEEHDVTDYVGIDGDYVDRTKLMIPRNRFHARDLVEPISIGRRFDLAVSLEVAEHLPEDSAEGFVESLIQLAPIVLFSAAVPGQGGVHHVNEQWPSYWVSRFAHHDYVVVDAVRSRVWDYDDVAWWYAQNTLLFVSSAGIEARAWVRAYHRSPGMPVDIVHPRMYEGLQRASRELTTRQMLANLPGALARSIGWRFGR